VRRLAPQDRVASEIFTVLAQMLVHTHPAALQFHPGLVQHRQVGEALQPLVDQLLDQLEERIGNQSFLAGPRPTVADCTLFALIDAVFSRIRLRSSRALPAAARLVQAVPGASKRQDNVRCAGVETAHISTSVSGQERPDAPAFR